MLFSSSQTKPQASSYLDKLETAENCKKAPELNNTNGFGDIINEKLYSVSDIVGSIKYYKQLSLDLVAALEVYSPALLDRSRLISACGNHITVGTADGETRLLHANFCRQRICPMCQRRKSLKTAADIFRIQEHLGEEYRWLHLVLTVPNCKNYELTKTVNRLYKTSSELFRDKRIKQGFKGALRALEISYNNTDDSYHPHLHCLIAVKKSYFTSRYYLPQSLLRWKWVYYWGSPDLLQININAIKDAGGVAEVAKYCVKPLELDLDNMSRAHITEQMFDTLYGRRLLQAYGVVREAAKRLKIRLDEDEDTQPDKKLTDVKRFVYDRKEDTYIPDYEFTF